ncbi:MAG: PrsW family intramembrane metalloprotease [Candidatus Taylorbacteria bacterium]|nr:PrsW family intramembrane metalloprotease [Candidatus Taylorbacteria bacterium]
MTGSQFAGALLVGLIPSLLWLFFWMREDADQPEPRSLLAGCFFAGMFTVVVAIFAEQYIGVIVNDISLKYTLWSGIEEIFKFAAVALVALFTRHNDEPIDAMVYCIAVALGFAALENALFVMAPLSHGELATSIIHGNLRSIGATLVHVVSSAIIGFSLGLTFYRGHAMKFLSLVIGLIVAVAIHTSFNLSIINAGPTDTLKAFGWIWGAVVVMIILFEEVKAVRPKLVT